MIVGSCYFSPFLIHSSNQKTIFFKQLVGQISLHYYIAYKSKVTSLLLQSFKFVSQELKSVRFF